MTEYLIFHGVWHIAHPGAIADHTEECNRCDYGVEIVGRMQKTCSDCNGTMRVTAAPTIRLAWFDRESAFICWDYDNPEVKELPSEV